MLTGQHELQEISVEASKAFIHVNVVPTIEAILYDQTILIDGDRIVVIGPSNDLEPPSTAMIIDGEGGYLMPGLADTFLTSRVTRNQIPGEKQNHRRV